MPKRGRVYVNRSISFPPRLLEEARERAARLRLSFSAYVQKCLETDLKERRPMVFEERVEPAKAAAEDAGPVAGGAVRRRPSVRREPRE